MPPPNPPLQNQQHQIPQASPALSSSSSSAPLHHHPSFAAAVSSAPPVNSNTDSTPSSLPPAARFNPFSLPSVQHRSTSSDLSPEHPSLPPNASSATHHPQTPSLPPQQQHQQASVQSSTTPSSTAFSFAGSSSAGGGGGSASAGSKLQPAKLGQINLLIAIINDQNFDAKCREINQIIDGDMSLNTKVLQKLIVDNASSIFSRTPTAARGNEAKVLASIIESCVKDPTNVKEKLADAINPDGAPMQEAVELFSDFDLAKFFAHFGLDPLQESILALAFIRHPRNDLREKAISILSGAFSPMLGVLANPNKHQHLTGEDIAFIIQQYLADPPLLAPDAALQLSRATRSRYEHLPLPRELRNEIDSIERRRPREHLMQLIEEFGFRATEVPQNAVEAVKLRAEGYVHEEELAETLLSMALNHPGKWNSVYLVRALMDGQRLAPDFDWTKVIEGFDRGDVVISGDEAFKVLFAAIHMATEGTDFPMWRLWGGRWQNPQAQASILLSYLKSQPDVRHISGIPKVFAADDFADAPPAHQAQAESYQSQPLNSYDAVNALLHLAVEETSQNIHTIMRAEIDRSIKYSPELILCGALLLPKPRSADVDHIIRLIFGLLFENHQASTMAFWWLWRKEKQFVLETFANIHAQNPLAVTRVLDLAQELKGLNDILEFPKLPLVLDVAALGGRRQYINLGKWLEDKLKKGGDEFLLEAYKFLQRKAKLTWEIKHQPQKPTAIVMDMRGAHTFLGTLIKSDSETQLAKNLQQKEIPDIQLWCLRAWPRLVNLGNGVDQIIWSNNQERADFTKEVDEIMQFNFKEFYADNIQIITFVERLKQWKVSTDPQHQEVFACTLHGLFDEWPLFHSYPVNALAKTAVLFGGLIGHHIIDHIPLQVALSIILRSLQLHEPHESMFKFGIQALMQFQPRLPEWKNYCNQLSQVDFIQSSQAWEIIKAVKEGTAPAPPVNGNGPAENDASMQIANGVETEPESSPTFTAAKAPPLLRDLSFYEEPSEDIQDKVLFIVNNISQNNLEKKMPDLREALEEKHHQWFADYLVVQRVKVEPNQQELYIRLLDMFERNMLLKEVIRETYVNISKLFNGENIMNDTVHRAQLKNLGTWLGSVTLAKRIPINGRYLNFKFLIIEGFRSNRLAVVIPFVCKVLEQAVKCKEFLPPNPWTVTLLKMLKTLYAEFELRLQLKFEIEFLFKKHSQNLEDMPYDSISKFEDQKVLNQSDVKDESGPITAESLKKLAQFQPPLDFGSPTSSQGPSIGHTVVINPAIRADQATQVMIQTAVDRTYNEVIDQIVTRSVQIAAVATRNLILKDFATDADEMRLQEAAIGMCKRLAGNLALVTGKDPLRVSLNGNFRTIFTQNGYDLATIPEQTINLLLSDNIDNLCKTLKKQAEDRSADAINDSLQDSYNSRRQYRERAGTQTQPFVAREFNGAALTIPDCFKPTPGGLTREQLEVYSNIARGNGVSQADGGRALEGFPADYLPVNLQGTPGLPEPAQAEQQSSAGLSQPQGPTDAGLAAVIQRVLGIFDGLRKHAKQQAEFHAIEELPADHPIHQLFAQITSTLSDVPINTKNREIVSSEIASKLCQFLYLEAETELEVNCMVALLKKICDDSLPTAKDVVFWLAMDKDNVRIFNVPVMFALMQSKLLTASDLDSLVAKNITAGSEVAIDFLTQLLKVIQSSQPQVALRTDFARSLDAVAKCAATTQNRGAVVHMWRELQGDLGDESLSLQQLEEQLDRVAQIEYIFCEWIKLCDFGNAGLEKMFPAFIAQLSRGGLLTELELSVEVFRVCLEFCIHEYAEDVKSPNKSYMAMDALAKLMVFLTKHQVQDSNSARDKMAYLDSMLAIVVLVFNKKYQAQIETFPYKVFFRLFSTLLYEFHQAEDHLGESSGKVLETLAECFLTLQPNFFPGFVFQWATIIGHRFFLPKLLNYDEGRAIFSRIFETYINYFAMLLEDPSATNVSPEFGRAIYKGLLRFMLVLHHDFQGYLAEYYFALCNAIPAQCTQLRNLVLSAIPPESPDMQDPISAPFDAWKNLQGSQDVPAISGNIFGPLGGLKDIVDSVLKTFDGPTETQLNLILGQLEPDIDNESTNISAINSLVLYVGMEAVESAGPSASTAFNANSSAVVLLTKLTMELSAHARRLFVNAMCNHLRYLNSYTLYFSNLVLHLYASTASHSSDEVRPQILRAMFERVVVYRPHPWGIIVVLSELFKRHELELWDLPFIKEQPEITSVVRDLLSKLRPFDNDQLSAHQLT